MNVYLVEDSAMVRERMATRLDAVPNVRVSGHAEDAAAAIRGILESRPDVVLLDLKLAAGSGFDVLRALHAQAPQIEVYMLSNFSAPPYRQMAERLGARGFFDKSSEFERLFEVVAERAGVLPS